MYKLHTVVLTPQPSKLKHDSYDVETECVVHCMQYFRKPDRNATLVQ
ncbi:hypothetical protein [uncultured Vibrio sp.]|nr:hypothetical protein [uncultured Vibrio sp.]